MNTLYIPEAWGWKGQFHAAWAATLAENRGGRSLIPSRIVGREHHLYEVVVPDFCGMPDFEAQSAEAGQYGGVRVSGRFEYEAKNPSDYPVTGDWVLVDQGEASLRIHAVLPRRSTLSRGSAGVRTEEQVLAANLDTIFLVFALDGGRNFLPRLLERGLVTAKNSGAAACIVLNKADLASDDTRDRALVEAAHAAPTVPVVVLSAKTGEGLGELTAFLTPGETVGMLGKSGVGKSALLNALAALEREEVTGKENDSPAREGNIRQDDLRGRHTTTSSRLYRLNSGLLLIDSPGIRELKIWGDAGGLDWGFPEIVELAEACRFSDCSHSGELGCAVAEALESGNIDAARYQAYQGLSKEQAWLERRKDERAQREEKQKWKQISKFQKELKKSRR